MPSKSGALKKFNAPVLAFRLNKALSVPPDSKAHTNDPLGVTLSLATNVPAAVVFSASVSVVVLMVGAVLSTGGAAAA